MFDDRRPAERELQRRLDTLRTLRSPEVLVDMLLSGRGQSSRLRRRSRVGSKVNKRMLHPTPKHGNQSIINREVTCRQRRRVPANSTTFVTTCSTKVTTTTGITNQNTLHRPGKSPRILNTPPPHCLKNQGHNSVSISSTYRTRLCLLPQYIAGSGTRPHSAAASWLCSARPSSHKNYVFDTEVI